MEQTTKSVAIDGDIGKAAKVKLTLETAGEESVSDELYANLYSWLCNTLQQERNHWKRQFDATLQQLNDRHKDSLKVQSSLQKILDKFKENKNGDDLDKVTAQGEQNTQEDLMFSYESVDFEDKIITTESLLQELEARLGDLFAMKVSAPTSEVDNSVKSTNVSEGGQHFSKDLYNNSIAMQKKTSSNSNSRDLQTQKKPWHDRKDLVPICLPTDATKTVGAVKEKTPRNDKIVQTTKDSNSIQKSKVASAESEKHKLSDISSKYNKPEKLDKTLKREHDLSQHEARKNDLSAKNPIDETEIPTDSTNHNDGGISKVQNIEDKNTIVVKDDQRMDGKKETKGDRKTLTEPETEAKTEQESTVLISKCQVWSSASKQSEVQQAIVHPYLRRGGNKQKESFSVKRFVSLAQEERQQYEKAIQGKKKEIKFLKSDLEEALDQVEKLQKVIQRLYLLNRHLKETPKSVADDLTEEAADARKKAESGSPGKKMMSSSLPSLKNLPMFQPMPVSEMALWKVHMKNKGSGDRKSDLAHCLRCQRIFKPSENSNVSCRYHRNGQEAVEKYDSRGKLVRVVYKWACCQRDVDAPGCTHSQHI